MADSQTTPAPPSYPTIQSDAGLRLHFIDGVPHVLDTDLGASLGMAQPRNIRATMRKRLDKLERLGTTHAVREWFISGNGAERKTKAYYLNEKQAPLVTSLSETERGWDLHILLIEVFTAWRQGKLPSVAGHAALHPAGGGQRRASTPASIF